MGKVPQHLSAREVTDHILATLARTGWRVSGKDGAAARLAVQRSTLNSLMKRLGISRPV